MRMPFIWRKELFSSVIHITDKNKILTEDNVEGITKKVNGKEVLLSGYKKNPLVIEAPCQLYGGG